MKTKYTVLVATIGGFALGAIAVQALHAQAKPMAYGIAEVTVNDKDAYSKEFLPVVRKTIADAGGKFLAAGGKTTSHDRHAAGAARGHHPVAEPRCGRRMVERRRHQGRFQDRRKIRDVPQFRGRRIAAAISAVHL